MESISNSFTGSYRYTLDAKGRVNIPSKMRKALRPSNHSTFVATRGADPCIVIYPLEVWQIIEEKLMNLNKGRALNRHFTRNFIRHAELVQYDTQGRVALPAHLIEYASIDKNVEIVGMIDRIEIWNPDKLGEVENQFEGAGEEFESIANEINF